MASHRASVPGAVNDFAQWLRLLLGLLVVFALFQWSALELGSDRGQAGLIVGALVVVATAAAELFLFRQRIPSVARTLGLGMPASRGLFAGAGLCAALLFAVPVFVLVSGGRRHDLGAGGAAFRRSGNGQGAAVFRRGIFDVSTRVDGGKCARSMAQLPGGHAIGIRIVGTEHHAVFAEHAVQILQPVM